MSQLLWALITMVLGVAGCVGYFYGSNYLLDRAFPAQAANPAIASQNINRANAIRPWLFLGPAFLLLSIYLIFPILISLVLSIMDD